MTDKYTMQQKVKRLREITSYRGENDMYTKSPLIWLESWLDATKHHTSKEDMIDIESHMPKDFLAAVWDVHTGIAFTKLYKALK